MFNWQTRLHEAYARFPEAERRPVIGITGNYGEQTAKIAEGYYKSVIAAGGVPLVIPPSTDVDVIINTLERIDALLLSGGGDYNPLFCGEEPSTKLGGINAERDMAELLITRLAYERNIPMLGICRGIQTLAMALGGHVRQDISDTTTVKHSQDADRTMETHTVTIDKDSTLHTIYNSETLTVNSFHHQAVDNGGSRFRATAWSADNIVEAMESCEHKPILGVQWHPECVESGLPLFEWLVEEAEIYRSAHRVHDEMITLDSHCDTPMFFPQGVNFAHRDERILTDLHKMTAGRLDTTIMAAYIPQPKAGQTFSEIAPLGAQTPSEYADIIFDKIEEIVKAHGDHLAICNSKLDLALNKDDRRSIMLAIENGLAIEGSLDKLRHFAERGIVYMTLCHNGDNDICDSAKGTQTHGGLSTFGREVIKEMNRLGIIVDMSHASEESFYQALEASEKPIVCSHSCCRALCDHPRNLTDDQMRQLAERGGVMQITLYPGFLRADGKATLMDVMAHLEHAIEIMGIDHVGIGTDFDGDGGVPGFADAADAINFTREMLRRRYPLDNIMKIWGENFMSLMHQVKGHI